MDFFSKIIPERKWIDVGAELHNRTKAYRADWFNKFVGHTVPANIGLDNSTLSPAIGERIGILQFAAAATTVRENGYVKPEDFDFFIDMVCLSIASKKWENLIV